jgi:hypothetical protein
MNSVLESALRERDGVEARYYRNGENHRDHEDLFSLVSLTDYNYRGLRDATNQSSSCGTACFSCTNESGFRLIKNGSSSFASSDDVKRIIENTIFKCFSRDTPELERIDGTCEVFYAMNGTNTGWHKDGFQRGCYIGHALLSTNENAEEEDSAGWFEFALIKSSISKENYDDDDCFSIEFIENEHLEVNEKNFIACDAMNGRTISIFEDARIFHRSPRVKACWNAMELGLRKIARFDFVGRDANGEVLQWRKPSEIKWTPILGTNEIAPKQLRALLDTGCIDSLESYVNTTEKCAGRPLK